MRAIKITDLSDHPISYTEFAGRVIFGGKVPSRFTPGNTYNSGDYVYFVNNGELEVWRCTQRGTYMEISSVQWVRATIPNIVADLIKYLDIDIPDSDTNYETDKCFDCRAMSSVVKSNEIQVHIPDNMRKTPQFLEVYVDGLYVDHSRYIIDEMGTIKLIDTICDNTPAMVIQKDAISPVAGMIDIQEFLLEKVDDFVYELPVVELYNNQSKIYDIYVDGVRISDDSYMINDDNTITINEFISISGETDSFIGTVYCSKRVCTQTSTVICRVTYSVSANVDVASTSVRIPMNATDKYKINTYDLLYYTDDDEVSLFTDKYGPIIQNELNFTDYGINILNKSKPLNNGQGHADEILSIGLISEAFAAENAFAITDKCNDGCYYFPMYGNEVVSIGKIDTNDAGYPDSVSIASGNMTISQQSFFVEHNDKIYTINTDGEISQYDYGEGVLTSLCDMALDSDSKNGNKCAAIHNGIIYILIVGNTNIYKYDIENNVLTIDNESLIKELDSNVIKDSLLNLVCMNDIIYIPISETESTFELLTIDTNNTTNQNIITLNKQVRELNKYGFSMCKHNRDLYIYGSSAHELIIYSQVEDKYSNSLIHTDSDCGKTLILQSDKISLTYGNVGISNYTEVTCSYIGVNDVLLLHKQYMHFESEYDGYNNKINSITIPMSDNNRRSVGIPFMDIDEHQYLMLFDSSGKYISNSEYIVDIDRLRIDKHNDQFSQPYISIFNTANTKLCTTIEYQSICHSNSEISMPSYMYDSTVAIVNVFNKDGLHIPTSKYEISSVDGTIVSNDSSFEVGSKYIILLEQYNTLSVDSVKDIRHMTASEDDQLVYDLPFNYDPATDVVIIYDPNGRCIAPYTYTMDDDSNTISFSGLSIHQNDVFDVYITRLLSSPITINEITSIREGL